jgi:hypothetical protein
MSLKQLKLHQGCTNPRHQVTKVTQFAQWHVIFVGTKYEFVSCHPSGTCNFEVTPRFLENMCAPELCLYCFLPHPFLSIPVIQSFNSTGRSYWQHNYTNYNKTQRFNKKMSASKHVFFWHLKACEWHFDLSHLQIQTSFTSSLTHQNEVHLWGSQNYFTSNIPVHL